MILEFKLPLINSHMTEVKVECLYVAPGAALRPGEKLLDLSVNLGDSFAQDCPPISYYRVVVREVAILREILVPVGQSCKVGELVARFSTLPDEATDQPAQRGIRFVTASIVCYGTM